MKNTPKLFVLAGPSGVGKGTLVRKILKERENITLSVSMTTRKKRPSEKNGKEYFFVSQKEFDKNIKENNFLEYEKFFDASYGTLRGYVTKTLANGCDVILEIDTRGAINIKKNFPDAVMIFIKPPSFAILEKRIRGRGAETEKQILSRLEKAKEELTEDKFFDYIITNDDLETANDELLKIIERSKNEEG
jgi:guanylate kinase